MAGDVSADLTGRRLGNYRIDGVLGHGGMSVMYKATDVRLGRKVALKVIGEHLGADAEFRERFVDEARNTSAIDHPNIVPLYDFGELDDMLYIAMRLVDGSDLASLIADSAMHPERAVGLLDQVADALDTLHERGLVHLDVKPANVLVTSREAAREHVYIADFGLTRRGTTGHRTRGGDFLGSPTYAAPEHLRGEALDGRTDQYALACMLYACLAGQPPFTGDVQAVIKGHLGGEVPSVARAAPAVPDAVDDVVRKGMAKTADQRYGSCVELVEAVRAALNAGPERDTGGPAPMAVPTAGEASTMRAEEGDRPGAGDERGDAHHGPAEQSAPGLTEQPTPGPAEQPMPGPAASGQSSPGQAAAGQPAPGQAAPGQPPPASGGLTPARAAPGHSGPGHPGATPPGDQVPPRQTAFPPQSNAPQPNAPQSNVQPPNAPPPNAPQSNAPPPAAGPPGGHPSPAGGMPAPSGPGATPRPGQPGPPHGVPPSAHYAPYGTPPQGLPPQGVPPQGLPPQGAPPPGMPPPGTTPPGVPSHGMPPQGGPPPPGAHPQSPPPGPPGDAGGPGSARPGLSRASWIVWALAGAVLVGAGAVLLVVLLGDDDADTAPSPSPGNSPAPEIPIGPGGRSPAESPGAERSSTGELPPESIPIVPGD